MTDEQIRELGPAFSAFLRRFRSCFGQDRTAAHFDTCCHALLSPLPRKSVEPAALERGCAVRTLQLFLASAKRGHQQARDVLQRHVASLLPDLPCLPAVEHGFRLAKQEAGQTRYEGRLYTGLMRHLILVLVVMGFVGIHADGLRGGNPEVTREQVCRVLNAWCGVLLRRRRGTGEMQHVGEVIRYHQRRNAQARTSHKKRRH